jgi:hypothetical protein
MRPCHPAFTGPLELRQNCPRTRRRRARDAVPSTIHIQTLHSGLAPRFFGEKSRLQPYSRFLGVEEGEVGEDGSRIAQTTMCVQRSRRAGERA